MTSSYGGTYGASRKSLTESTTDLSVLEFNDLPDLDCFQILNPKASTLVSTWYSSNPNSTLLPGILAALRLLQSAINQRSPPSKINIKKRFQLRRNVFTVTNM